jgi:voltage-gated potassium channel
VVAAERRVRKAMAAVVVIVAAGIVGYMQLEGWTFVDALYMAITTLTTVGYMEVRPLSDAGRLFTIGYITVGVGTFFYLAATFAEYVIGGALNGVLRSHHMQHKINAMSGHHIVCGFGRVGEQVAHDLRREGLQVVLVEREERALERCGDQYPFVAGDATDEQVLERAGIARAAGLVAASGEDVTNIVVTLTARGMNGALQIVSRGGADDTIRKLRRAGADHVISPYRLAGQRIAAQLQYPRVSAFLDLVMHSGELELWLKEVTVGSASRLDGRALADCRIHEDIGATVLAIAEGGTADLVTTPPASHTLSAGDVLIVLGTHQQLQRLAELANGASSGARG